MAAIDDLLAVAQAIQADVRAATERAAPAAEPARGVADRISGAFEGVARGAGRAQVALTTFVGTFDRVISSLGAGMARFVQLANPATVFRFNLAVENAMSAIGRVLVPVMEQFTAIVQKLGNAIESLNPETKKLIGGLALGGGLAGVLAAVAGAAALLVGTFGAIPVLVGTVAAAVGGLVLTAAAGSQSFMAAMNEVLKALGTLAEVLARTVVPVLEGAIVPAFVTLAAVLDAATASVVNMIDAARKMAGLDPIDYDPNKKTALATRPAQMGDLRGYANRAYTSAYNSQAGTADLAKAHLEESKKHTSLLTALLKSAVPVAAPASAVRAAVPLAAIGDRARPAAEAAFAVPSLLARMAGVL